MPVFVGRSSDAGPAVAGMPDTDRTNFSASFASVEEVQLADCNSDDDIKIENVQLEEVELRSAFKSRSLTPVIDQASLARGNYVRFLPSEYWNDPIEAPRCSLDDLNLSLPLEPLPDFSLQLFSFDGRFTNDVFVVYEFAAITAMTFHSFFSNHELCGCLFGQYEKRTFYNERSGERRTQTIVFIRDARAVPNIEPSYPAQTCEWAQDAVSNARDACSANELEPVGIYHTHGCYQPMPSRTDLFNSFQQQCSNPDKPFVSAIVSPLSTAVPYPCLPIVFFLAKKSDELVKQEQGGDKYVESETSFCFEPVAIPSCPLSPIYAMSILANLSKRRPRAEVIYAAMTADYVSNQLQQLSSLCDRAFAMSFPPIEFDRNTVPLRPNVCSDKVTCLVGYAANDSAELSKLRVLEMSLRDKLILMLMLCVYKCFPFLETNNGLNNANVSALVKLFNNYHNDGTFTSGVESLIWKYFPENRTDKKVEKKLEAARDRLRRIYQWRREDDDNNNEDNDNNNSNNGAAKVEQKQQKRKTAEKEDDNSSSFQGRKSGGSKKAGAQSKTGGGATNRGKDNETKGKSKKEAGNKR